MKKYIRNKVEVQCSFCKKDFLKDESEVKRNLKLNRKDYCSRACLGQVNALHVPLNTDSSRLIPSNRRDEFTGFREHLRRIKYRNKEVNITVEELKEVFILQNGICPYSKIALIPVDNATGKCNPIYTMSLDRKDSSIGYIKENVQFISIAMNHMKNTMSDEQVKELLLILKTI